jgi:methanogenic corrinoid protein MtbC1
MSAATAEAIRRRRETIVEDAMRSEAALRVRLRTPELAPAPETELISARSCLDFLVEALEAEEPSLFLEYLAWADAACRGHRLPPELLPITLRALRDSVEEHLLWTDATAAAAVLDSGMRALGQGATTPGSHLLGNPLEDLCRGYLDALLTGHRHKAAQRILRAVDGGLEIRELYLYVIQPVMHEVGRLWQLGEISVAQEHFCTAATQLVMSMLYPKIFGGNRRGLRLVATCVGRERHEIGVRMVADFFELEGWDTYYLGADTPTASILHALETFGGDVLAVSTTMVYNIAALRKLIGELRKTKIGRKAKILVGGYPFNVVPQLWRAIGADGSGESAETAVATAERLVERGGRR